MNLVFSGSNSTEIEFKVGVAGTAVPPQRVMAVLEQDGMSLSFAAKEQEGSWKAIISNVGQVFKAGVANFSINVILNDKLFIPMKSQVTIEQELPVSVQMVDTAASIEPTPVIANEQHQSTEPVSSVDEVKAEVAENKPTVEVAQPVEELTPVVPTVQKFSLLRSIEPSRKPVTETKKIVQKPVVESVPAVTSFTLKRVKVVTE